jgi:hypothetical protein
MTAKGIADCAPYRAYRRTIVLKMSVPEVGSSGIARPVAACVPESHLVRPVPGPFPLQGSVDELTGLTHPYILYGVRGPV